MSQTKKYQICYFVDEENNEPIDGHKINLNDNIAMKNRKLNEESWKLPYSKQLVSRMKTIQVVGRVDFGYFLFQLSFGLQSIF